MFVLFCGMNIITQKCW